MRFELQDADDAAALRAVVSRARQASPRCGETVVVAVDGPSGSGKTILADRLAAALGAPVLHMDDLYPGWDGLTQAVGLLTDRVLGPLARGEPAAYRRWDWGRSEWRDPVAVVRTRLLVVEGCASTVSPAGEYAAVKVWMDADPAVRMRRGIERDGEAYRPYWERWARHEAALFAADRTPERADVVIDTTGLP